MEFLNKAKDNLRAARICFENDLYDACVNRAYYAALQAVVSALSAKGVRREKIDHKWVQAEFSGKLIHRQKVYPSKLKSYLSDMQALRDQADYKSENVSRQDAAQQLRKSEEMLSIIGKESA